MATTTNYGWTTPDDTDYVKDGAAAIRSLGSAVDTSVKSLSPGTTAGDVDYYTSSTAKARLGIGAVGQVLTSTGSAPSWASPATGFDPVLSSEIATQYIKSAASTTAITATANSTYYTPIFLPTFTADRIGFRTATGTLLTNGTTRLGLYNCSLTTGKPTTVVFDAGTITTNAGPADFLITISQNITAGWYFLAFNTTSTWQPTSTAASSVNPYYNVISATIGGVPLTHFKEAGITGAFATAGTLTSESSGVPVVGLRVA